ncbi:uncharacterized protein LOC134775161 [Penaeus indicus]|uniref:uncharacterized protein LOC134775161 n=1 Tax=Penaeus indicus TaxID=29960 RepID=UPI00300C4525
MNVYLRSTIFHSQQVARLQCHAHSKSALQGKAVSTNTVLGTPSTCQASQRPASKLENLPTGYSERIISLRLPLQNKQHATMFSIYAPTLQAAPTEKEKFYTDLRNLVQNAPAEDKVIILGDFNTRVGKDSEAWKGVVGKHGVGNCNDNGRLLLEFCTDQQFTISNTIFQQKNSLKTTWMHPRSRHWHLIDYILTHQRDIRDVLHTSDVYSIGTTKISYPASKKNKDWFDENNLEIKELLEKKRSAHQAHLAQPTCQEKKKTAFQLICSNLQRKLREIQNDLAERTGDCRGFYEALKAVYGPSRQVQSPLRSADDQTLLTDKTSILSRWSDHFHFLFSANCTVQNSAILRIPQQSVKSDLDELPTLKKTVKAIKQLKSARKTTTGPQRCTHHYPVQKQGEKSVYSNYRGKTLLSIAGKILARILLNRLVANIAEEHIPESQCGFRANRDTTDMVFVLRQLQEKCREQNKGLYMTFVDLTKVFDTVSRKSLWKIMKRLGCPQKFLSMVIQILEDQRRQVRHSNDLPKPFPISNSTKQLSSHQPSS